jgi:Autotransporter beta-domain
MATKQRGRKPRLAPCLAISASCAASLLAPTPTLAQDFTLIGANVQKRANGVLALMGYTLTPDVTTGSLSINDGSSANPDFRQTSFGGGFTASRNVRLYLEGTVGYSRYDPTFVASDGQVERPIPVKWNALSATGGIGWDFPIARELVLRPIFNFSLGHVESDGAVAASIIQNRGGCSS